MSTQVLSAPTNESCDPYFDSVKDDVVDYQPGDLSFAGPIRQRLMNWIREEEQRIENEPLRTHDQDDKVVYMMYGLPSCGKSTTARRLAGTTGIVCESDAYFMTEVGDDPNSYDWQDDLRKAARDWNFARFKQGLKDGVTPVIMDRDNCQTRYARKAVEKALKYGYRVEMRPADTPWWREIETLMRYRPWTDPVLAEWARELSFLSRRTHDVREPEMLDRMFDYDLDITVEDLLNYKRT